MATLTVKFEEIVQGEYTIREGRVLMIGRGENNDVVIDNLAVSGSHAKIDGLDKGFLLTDLQSKNGTFVNGQPITSHWLEDGDVILVGKHTLVFSLTKKESLAPEEEAGDKTMVLDTDMHRFMKGKIPSEGAVEEAEKDRAGTLSFLKGGEGEVTLQKKITKIGKASSNDIVIGGFFVGKTAATISKRPTGYYLSYVGGMARPKVNGKRVDESVRLKEFDVIEVGSARMEFFVRD